jgi:hypothetical protein
MPKPKGIVRKNYHYLEQLHKFFFFEEGLSTRSFDFV